MKRYKRAEIKNENPLDRLNALADGVFAIVMTLLVLELGVGDIAKTASDQGLLQGLLEMWPRFLIYGIIVSAFILATALGRAELAALWPTIAE